MVMWESVWSSHLSTWLWGPTRRRATKEEAKILTVIGLTTMHAVCRIPFMLYPSLYTEDRFYEIDC